MDTNLTQSTSFIIETANILEKNNEFNATELQDNTEITSENQLNFDLENLKIFSHAKVCIDSAVLNLLSKNPELFLSSLKEKCKIVVEKSLKTDDQYIIRGEWSQILDTYENIKLKLNAQRQPLAGMEPSNRINNNHKEVHLDKAITCDIIQGDVLSLLSSENPKQPRVVSVIVHRSRLPSQRIKEKYRMKRIHNKSKRQLNPCLKTSNKFVSNKKISSEKEVVEQNDADRLDTENMEPEPVINNNNKVEDYANVKPKKNYEELTPYKFFCKLCSFKTKRESHYQKHLEIHKKVTTLYKCEECSFTSIRLSHMRRHEISHSSTIIPCKHCAYKTDSMKLLVRHMKIKHERDEEEQPKDLLQCNECAYQTTKQYRFQRHLRVHRESSPSIRRLFQCDKCVYKTKRKEHYIRHVNNVHTNKRPYLCDFCGKAFKRTDALKQHRVIHSTVDPLEIQFRCTVCDKNCRSHAHLLEHQAVHSNVRSFLCEICGASFKTRSVQRKHVQTIHKKPRAFSCQICDKKFNTNYALKRHVRLHEIGVDATSASQIQTNCTAVSASQLSATESVSTATTVAQQSVILLPTSDGQLHAASGDLNGTTIPFTIHSNVLGNNSTIQLLHGADSIVSGGDSANLVPLQESISGDDGHSSAQTYIQSSEATTALLYLTTTNYTHF